LPEEWNSQYRRQVGIDAAAPAAALEGPDAAAVAVGGDGDDTAPLPAGREFAQLGAGAIGIGQIDRRLARRLSQGRHGSENERQVT